MATESNIQSFVHKLEEGGWARWIQIILLLAAFGGVATKMLFFDFRGLSDAKGMEQAQISREIAKGNGFSTQVIHPLAIFQFTDNLGEFPEGNVPDTYFAPLGPAVNALPLWLTGADKAMSPQQINFRPDQMITALALIFFIVGVWVNFLTLRRLFDPRIAWISIGLVLVCADFYRLAQSGLPQMLMFLIFSGCVHTLARGVEAFYGGRGPTFWLAASGLLFGLLALTHALTIWIFVGALIFVAIIFRPRGRDAGIMAALFLLVYSPWLVRNYTVCGNPLGLAGYAALADTGGKTESEMMRNMESAPSVSLGAIRRKLQNQLGAQLSDLYGNLGRTVAAPVFFLALMHRFRRNETRAMLWGTLLMVLGAVIGMAMFGLSGANANANNLYPLLIPLMIAYGMALLLVLWGRLLLPGALLRTAFVTLIFAISAFPFIATLISPPALRFQWPPYAPPIIGYLAEWTTPDEVIASDQPWAVAWYANRRSIRLPLKMKEFVDMHDYVRYGRIVGLYLTPVSGDAKFVSEIQLGEYKEWAALVTRSVDASKFVLPAVTALWQDAQLIYFSDRERWKTGSE